MILGWTLPIKVIIIRVDTVNKHSHYQLTVYWKSLLWANMCMARFVRTQSLSYAKLFLRKWLDWSP